MPRPIAIDLFSGVGGMSLGFEQAGFDVAAAVEYDSVHAASHKFNFPHWAVLPRSVVGLTGAEIRAAAGIGQRPVAVVCGGPPCQGFSLIGQRVLDDPRNALVKEFVRLVRELDAETFVFENVKGLTLGDQRQVLDELIADFEAAGYAVRAPWHVLNAADHGTPQSRQRLILLGARRDRPLPDYPEPTTVRPDRPRKGSGSRALPADALDLPGFAAGPVPGPTCADALDDLPDAENFPELLAGESVRVDSWGTPSAYTAALRCTTSEGWHYGYRRAWDPLLLTASGRTTHTEITRRRFAAHPPGKIEPISRFFKLPPDGVANTLRAGSDSKRGAFTSPRPIHHRHPRCITVREMARLSGFPDWFRFHNTVWNGARQIGNAVPPPLARALAAQIIAALGHRPARPAEEIPLGDPALLDLSMNQASAHWGIARPIGQRDRKSGAKKRTQAEIEAGVPRR